MRMNKDLCGKTKVYLRIGVALVLISLGVDLLFNRIAETPTEVIIQIFSGMVSVLTSLGYLSFSWGFLLMTKKYFENPKSKGS